MPNKTSPQKDNVVSSVEYLLQERGIDTNFTFEEKERLYRDITQSISQHYLDNIQSMITDRLAIDCYTSRSMLDKMYHSLDMDEKPLLEKFNEEILPARFPHHDRKTAINQLKRIMNIKVWHSEWLNNKDYTICESIISYMTEEDLVEFQRLMNALEISASNNIENHSLASGAKENIKSIVLYLGKEDIDNQQENIFYHRLRRDTKAYLKFDEYTPISTIIAKCEAIIKNKKLEYDLVIIAGEGIHATIANLIAHSQNIPALLINPETEREFFAFPMTNPNQVTILLDKPHNLMGMALPDNWQCKYLWMQEQEIRKNVESAMADICGDEWVYVAGIEQASKTITTPSSYLTHH